VEPFKFLKIIVRLNVGVQQNCTGNEANLGKHSHANEGYLYAAGGATGFVGLFHDTLDQEHVEEDGSGQHDDEEDNHRQDETIAGVPISVG